jgi:hypothetical protein
MIPTAPEWLTRREGSLRPGLHPETVFVILAGQPQYRLDARPAKNQFACAVTQTVNGRRLDDAVGFPTAEAALTGGLDQLRQKLGW